MRIAVIGARRRRQGIGAHLARFCVHAGADVRAVVGTSEPTVEEARGLLEQATGVRARGYLDAAAMLDAEALDALVIASPLETHAGYLDLALRHGLHTLVEKPVCWGEPDPVARAEAHGRAFLEAGLHLHVNAQWPFTLAPYRRLFPDVRLEAATTFWMRLSPTSSGFDMVLDAMPHTLSVLAHVRPDRDARIVAPEVRLVDGDPSRLDLRFGYEAAGQCLDAQVELRRCPEQPRPTGYGFDGRHAMRQVELSTYALSFEADGRRVPVPDPTPLLVRSFLAAVDGGPPEGIADALSPGMRHLADLCAAYPQDAPSPRRSPEVPAS